MPVDDGGPRGPQPIDPSRWPFELAAVVVLGLGGLLTFQLWHRGGSNGQVAAATVGVLGLAAVLVAAPLAFHKNAPPAVGVGLADGHC